ncbi:hypothetical protein C4J95_0330 [Pseudomonas orientalis]|nr:hypothetical protein C4J96_0332 [Pseudomonas orientalis]AZE97822.1 hypothetical protein C4J95_0330 [Pseudomonas orientalis]
MASGLVVELALRIWVMPARILRQGNLPHKRANCMPVRQHGLSASKWPL